MDNNPDSFNLVECSIIFKKVDVKDKYSVTSGNYLRRHFDDPFPLPHIAFQIGEIMFEYVVSKGLVATEVNYDNCYCKWLRQVTQHRAVEMLARAELSNEIYPPQPKYKYCDPAHPWCTDVASYVIYGTEGVKREPPFLLLQRLVNGGNGVLVYLGGS